MSDGNLVQRSPELERTSSRAQFDGTPGELAADYYAQRASVGLIVTRVPSPRTTDRVTSRRRASIRMLMLPAGRKPPLPCIAR